MRTSSVNRCRHPSPGGAVVDTGVFCSPRHRPGGRRSSSRTRGVGPDCHSSATGRESRRTFSFFRGENENAPPRRFEKNGMAALKMRWPAPVAGDFCAFNEKRDEESKTVEKEKKRDGLQKKKQRRPLEDEQFFFSAFFFSPFESLFFLFFSLLSSHRWQTRGRKLLAKAAIVLHFLHKK